MTVVIGAVSNGRVYLAGDSYCGDEESSDPCKAPKVVKLTPTVGFGLCGDISSEVKVTTAATEILYSRKRITSKFLVEKLPQLLLENVGSPATEDSKYILGHSGHVYYVEHDFSVWEPTFPYVAIGRGRSIALGALAYAHRCGELDRDPEAALLKVMEICAVHSPWVSPPFTMLRI